MASRNIGWNFKAIFSTEFILDSQLTLFSVLKEPKTRHIIGMILKHTFIIILAYQRLMSNAFLGTMVRVVMP